MGERRYRVEMRADHRRSFEVRAHSAKEARELVWDPDVAKPVSEWAEDARVTWVRWLREGE